MNNKNKGEIGERIAIGELAKFGIDILLPMSDNLPFDFVIFRNNKFYKCQVKSSFQQSSRSSGAIYFSLVSNNWYSKKQKVYTKEDIDIFILCDGNSIYLFPQKDLEGYKSITIRTETPKNNQVKGLTLANTVILSEERLNYVFV
jgi:hypothetical protein